VFFFFFLSFENPGLFFFVFYFLNFRKFNIFELKGPKVK